ncbi:glutamine amidotransferase [Undibacterium sp.]|uniref:glutamine amidotransferase n=1 Tax=Undibacterium sp. TaxID=1914977 RepID=UPI00374D6A1C
MRTAVAIRHIHFEDLGTLSQVLDTHGYQIQYLDAAVDDLAALDALQPDLLIVLGGPIGAFDDDKYPFLTMELNILKRRLQHGLPVLGICLGAQLLARAMGAEVYPMGVKEIGFSPLQLTPEGMQSPLAAVKDAAVLHWHGDQFDIPPGAVRLAGTDVGINQAFSFGTQVLGLQFHLEADPQKIEHWLLGHAGELAQAGIDPRHIREQAGQHGARPTAAARQVMEAWLRGLGSGKAAG